VMEYTPMYQHRMDTLQDFTRHIQTTASAECEHSAQCGRAFRQPQSRLARSWNPRTSPLYLMTQAKDSINGENGVCRGCRLLFDRNVDEVREKTWEELPGVVGLPSWSDLIAELED
jgi:hypothetical protein